jgi:hypothetical protein
LIPSRERIAADVRSSPYGCAMSTAAALTIIGGVLEISGFGLIVAQLVRVQRREFGTPQSIARAQNWIRQTARLLGRRKGGTVHAAGVAMSASASMSGAASVWRNMGDSAPDRLDAIAANLNELHAIVDRLGSRHQQAIAGLRGDVDATRTELREHTAEQEAQRKAELRASITWEAWGVALFLAGIVCSVAGTLAG